jgi:hypothetical protein
MTSLLGFGPTNRVSRSAPIGGPTRQRFGTLRWQAPAARLTHDLTGGGPFLDGFVKQKAARGQEKKPYPRKASHLALFAAWEFAAQGKRTLIFSTQANWVEGYGKIVVALCKRGYLDSLLDDETRIARALEVGREWLGDEHPAVACLKLGVAIHHGRLPRPFLRELEMLLSEGVLKVIVASPTLSQGLDLNAAVLLVPSLYRSGALITGEEFAKMSDTDAQQTEELGLRWPQEDDKVFVKAHDLRGA